MAYKNVLILNFPKIAIEAPPLACALLSAICEDQKVSYQFIDCNVHLHQRLDEHLFDEILLKFAEGYQQTLSPAAKHWCDRYFNWLVTQCSEHDLVAISVFSHHSIPLVYEFLVNHRHKITAKIVIGGAGIAGYPTMISTAQPLEKFYMLLSRLKLIDHWILGEGDVAFRNLLSGSGRDGIDNLEFNHLNDFQQVPVPNYDKFDLDAYRMQNKRILGVEGSRGCVKRCTFCDIQNTWGSFKFKDGKSLAEEILILKDRYQVDHFWFNDSLINGSLRAFRDFVNHLAAHKQQDFTWSSQAIVRAKSSRDQEDFANMKGSGCETLAIGLESFSQSVRFHMGKKFTDEDMDHFFNLAQQYDIKILLLLIVGYPTETQKDFEHAIRQLEKYQHLADDGTISGIRIGATMGLIPGTPIHDMIDDLGIQRPKNRAVGVQWKLGENTLKRRVEWRVQMEDHARLLGYRVYDKEMSAEQMMLKYLELSHESDSIES